MIGDATILHPAGLLSGTRYDGPFGMTLQQDGGVITGVELEIGYVHRGVEGHLQDLNYYQGLLFCDRIDFMASPCYNLAFALAVEKLGSVEVPERAEHIRVILLELNRISSHLLFLAQLSRDLGADNINLFALRERELYCDLFELYCGSRLGFGAIRIGGVAESATDGFLYRVEKALQSCEDFLKEARASFCVNPIIESRLQGVGIITKEDIFRHGITGPNMRASGVDEDLRWNRPYAAYAQLHHEAIQLEQTSGDVYARLMYRIEEIDSSIKLVRRVLGKIPAGNHCNPVSLEFAPALGDVCVFVESPRGQLGIYMESDGSHRPSRVKFSTPSFLHMRYAEQLLINERVEDAFLIFNSLDIAISEVDR